MRLFAAIFLLGSVIACKQDELSNVPGELIGKWRPTSMQVTENGATLWQDTQSENYPFLYFSRYGEPVDSKGLLLHCGPTALNINGRPLKIEFHADPPSNVPIPMCIECLTWNLDLQQTNLVIEKCSSDGKMRFVKEK
jgi:hypothetical protein